MRDIHSAIIRDRAAREVEKLYPFVDEEDELDDRIDEVTSESIEHDGQDERLERISDWMTDTDTIGLSAYGMKLEDGEWFDLVDGEWVKRRASLRWWLMFWRHRRSPVCRTFWGTHGCRRRRGHRLFGHACTCGGRPYSEGHLFGEDVTDG